MRYIALLALCFCVSACGYKGIGGSYVGPLPEDAAVGHIAMDASNWLAEEHAPGHTKLFVLTPEKDAKNAFSTAFDSALREKGFTLLSASSSDGITLAYTLDSLKDDKGKDAAWYLQFRLSDGVAIARSYDADGMPEAGHSATQLERRLLQKATDKAGQKIDNAKAVVEEALQ